MMNEYYFEHIVHNLTLEEVDVLGILIDKDATATFKAVRRSELLEESELSTAKFRKVIGRLTATKLVDLVTSDKEHKVFLTSYGYKALEKSLEEVEDR